MVNKINKKIPGGQDVLKIHISHDNGANIMQGSKEGKEDDGL